MVTAVSGFIEQVGNMITGIPKHNYHEVVYKLLPGHDFTNAWTKFSANWSSKYIFKLVTASTS